MIDWDSMGATPQALKTIAEGVRAGGRLSDDDAVELLRCRDLISLGELASERRFLMVPGDTVTFIVDRNINYSNVCYVDCKFCAFYRHADADDAYVLSNEQIVGKVREMIAAGGTEVLMQGGLHPDLKIDWFERLFACLLYTSPSPRDS